jgi:tetratricopeptide (TPR) repeat protein
MQAWFTLALVRQDRHDFAGAAAALRQLLRVAPPRAEVEVNLGIVLQEAGKLDEALAAYGRAYRLREDSFGRIAHALAAPGCGRLWLDLDELRECLRTTPA